MIYELIYIVGTISELPNTVDVTFGIFSSYNTNPSFFPYSFFSSGSIGDDSDIPPQDAASDIS